MRAGLKKIERFCWRYRLLRELGAECSPFPLHDFRQAVYYYVEEAADEQTENKDAADKKCWRLL